MTHDCPVCTHQQSAELFREINGFPYFSCTACDSIFIDPDTLAAIDLGQSPRDYNDDYWEDELSSARERSLGDGLVRAAEAILFARRQVKRFLDLGAGPGYLLDRLAETFPTRPDTFHAVELFPPVDHSSHKNYIVGDVGSLYGKFDAGVCIEVIEHLTPNMLTNLVTGLASVAEENSTWLFNTGMPELVREQNPGYLDPKRRGHIVSYGIEGLCHIFEPKGFSIIPLPGRSFAFLAEYTPSDHGQPFTSDRFYSPLEANRQLLSEASLLYIAAFESARSYYYQHESLERARWALSLDEELRLERERSENSRTACDSSSPPEGASYAAMGPPSSISP